MTDFDFVPQEVLAEWHHKLHHTSDPFIEGIPKLELHIHIEGALTPELRWKFSQRNGTPPRNFNDDTVFESLEDLKASYHATGDFDFFGCYYDGLKALRTEMDFYELAMEYYERAAKMNIRYAEIFFDPQTHTSRGISFDIIMIAFINAQKEAATRLKVQSQWIMCCCRDMSLSSALEHLEMAIPYRGTIAGIGLDAPEAERPPMLFEELFVRARREGFKITCHCDVGQKATLANISAVLDEIGGGQGADRCDHGLSAAQSPELVARLVKQKLGLTICPWGNARWYNESRTLEKLRTLFDAGVMVTINSDDPPYMGDIWLTESLLFCRQQCGFTNADLFKVQMNAVDICWASEEVKSTLRHEIQTFVDKGFA